MNQLKLNFYFSPLLHEYSSCQSGPTSMGFALFALLSVLPRDGGCRMSRRCALGEILFIFALSSFSSLLLRKV